MLGTGNKFSVLVLVSVQMCMVPSPHHDLLHIIYGQDKDVTLPGLE